LSQSSLEKFAKVLFKGGGDIEAVLQRFDRLTEDEARMTVKETLEIVHSLVNNLKLVMDRTPGLLC
jgi:septation ring formation regulator EzrA